MRPRRIVPAFLAILTAAALTLATPPAEASALRLARLFSDHVVLQRDQPVRVWGWAESGADVVVRIGDHMVHTTTGTDGRWELLLPPFEAGGPWTLTAESATTLTVSDVFFGDVWVASGQSNMEWRLPRGRAHAAPWIRQRSARPPGRWTPARACFGLPSGLCQLTEPFEDLRIGNHGSEAVSKGHSNRFAPTIVFSRQVGNGPARVGQSGKRGLP